MTKPKPTTPPDERVIRTIDDLRALFTGAASEALAGAADRLVFQESGRGTPPPHIHLDPPSEEQIRAAGRAYFESVMGPAKRKE